VALTNLAIILTGALVVWHPTWRHVQYIFGLQYFTFWVGLHLLSSDIYGGLKRIRATPGANVLQTAPSA
jgi:hypothetical protein